MRRAHLALAALLAAAGAVAADEPSAVLRNTPSGGAVFTVQGATPSLPDGANLHVTLVVQGDFPTPIEAAYFRLVVEGGRYVGEKRWEDRTFPPDRYSARVELLVSEQSPPIRRLLVRERGYDPEQRVFLAGHELAVGTVEQRAAFHRLSLEALRAALVDLQALHQRVQTASAAPAAEQEGWPETESSLVAGLTAAVDHLRELCRPYVVWPERHLTARVESANNELARYIRDFGRGLPQAAPQALARIEHFLQTVLASVDSRLRPLRAAERGSDQERERDDARPDDE